MAQKTVLITGTSTGIGAACVERMAGLGWKVYAGVRKPEDGERLAKEVSGDVQPVILDVTRQEDVDAVLGRIENEVGSLDGLVNNAGIGVGGPIELLDDQEWHWQFDVNFFSVVTLTRKAFPLVGKANGRFVHIGSITGRVAAAGIGPYAASKHAIEAFNWSLRGELARNTKMTSSVIEPGAIKTEIWAKVEATVSAMEKQIIDADLRHRYGFLVEGQRGFLEEGKAKGIDPGKVADAVEHALTAKRPKARYLVGADARAAAVIAHLPDRVREAMIGLNGKRLEKAGRKLHR